MNRLCLLGLLGIIAPLSLAGCVERECTEEEREAAGADENDECTKFVGLQEYTAEDSETSRRDWAAGDDVRLTGRIRHVRVEQGDADDEVVVRHTAQVDLASGRSRSDVDRTLAHLETNMSRSGDTIVFAADRGSSDARLGATIVVELPAGFDGRLTIDKTNTLRGDVDVRFLGDARELVIDMNATGADLELRDLDSLRDVEINTHGDISTATPFSDSLRSLLLHNTIGDIDVSFGGVPDSHALIVAEFGDVSVRLPEDGDFNLSAVGEEGVSFGSVPNSCDTASDAETSKVMSCNGGDPDGLTFDLVADGEISVSFL